MLFRSTVPLNIPLTIAQATDIKNTKDFFLKFTGADGWDFAIDSVLFATPEPTSIALVGLALIGVGVVARRRKTA